MLLFVTIIHLSVALLLIILVLLQDSKGGGVFGMGSSGTNQVFSATGAANFLVQATRWLAITFAATCITLTYMTSHRGGSVTDSYVPAAAVPTAPTQTPQNAGSANTPADTAPAPVENKAPQNNESK